MMNFNAFRTNFNAMLESVVIATPVVIQIKKSYYGTLPKSVTDLPVARWDLTDNNRQTRNGRRDQTAQVNIQVLVARVLVEDLRTSEIATNLWFAARDVFDRDPTIGNTVSHSILQGGKPTVPVLLTHAGQTFIGLAAVLEFQSVELFS